MRKRDIIIKKQLLYYYFNTGLWLCTNDTINNFDIIFEIGDVLYMDETQETKVRASKKLAGLICHSSANFTEIKSVVTSLLQNLGYSMEISDSNNPSFIAGRVSDVKGTSANGNISGFFG